MTVPLGEAQQGSSHADAEFLHESHKHASLENVIEKEAEVRSKRRKLLRRNERAQEGKKESRRNRRKRALHEDHDFWP